MSDQQQTGHIQTVLGLIEPNKLGATLTHEHILSDLSHIAAPPDDPFEREIFYKPMQMEILGYLSHYYLSNQDGLRLDDIDTAIEEIALYKKHGGGAIVEASRRDCRRWRRPEPNDHRPSGADGGGPPGTPSDRRGRLLSRMGPL